MGLKILTFILSNSKWGTGDRLMGFLPTKFQLATPCHSRLRVRHVRDRRTYRRRPATLYAPMRKKQ